MHQEVIDWMTATKNTYPKYFCTGKALDVGSRDVNGTNKYLFGPGVQYEGIDIVPGPNVDHVGYIHEWARTQSHDYTCIVSTEMLEHDIHWVDSLKAMIDLMGSDSILVLTCAGQDRQEHGTRRSDPGASIGTPYYYRNITPALMREAFMPETVFRRWCFDIASNTLGPGYDTHFYGIK